ncbi:hypothetical protein [Leifsonia aquatica]|uniref:hypothetical protein n=1 Tax=Leifsonia aquatica TaxID=144185 RepID=UPI0038083C68
MVGIQVEGARSLRRTLRQAGNDLGELRQVHKEVGMIAAEASAALAPQLTGRLSTTVRSSGTLSAAVLRAGNNTRVPYAGPIHWGWYRHHIAPNPFLSLGAQDSEGRWLPVYTDYIDKTLDKIKGA